MYCTSRKKENEAGEDTVQCISVRDRKNIHYKMNYRISCSFGKTVNHPESYM